MTEATVLCNHRLAHLIREISAKHEASWVAKYRQRPSLNYETARYDGPLVWEGKYTKDIDECIHEVVGDDPITMILACLFTAGYSDMYDFCDQVLGPMKEEKA